MNSVRTAEAELYNVIDKENLDVLMLQETRTKVFKIRGRQCSWNSMMAKPKKHRNGGYLSGGLATVALNKAILKKDNHNTSEYILVSDLLIEKTAKSSSNDKTRGIQSIKLVNVYMQPDHKQEIKERLMVTLHRIQRAEPGTTIILGGDFNERLDEDENPMRKELL